MAWEENPRICLHMQLIAILSRTGVINSENHKYFIRNIPTPFDFPLISFCFRVKCN